jgi:hypothetical protein
VGNAFLPTTLMSPVFDVVNGGQKNLPTLPDYSPPLLTAKPILTVQSQLWTPESVLSEFKASAPAHAPYLLTYIHVGKAGFEHYRSEH